MEISRSYGSAGFLAIDEWSMNLVEVWIDWFVLDVTHPLLRAGMGMMGRPISSRLA
jgi:hypothetical protein